MVCRDPSIMPFDRIMPAVAAGEVDAGVIIHEGRFTFGSYGLRRLVDLGEWWEDLTGLPLPLGGIAVRRTLGRDTQASIDRAIRASVEHARAHPEATADYVQAHAQEMDPVVCQQHIDLYVNDFSLDYGAEGEDGHPAVARCGGRPAVSGGGRRGFGRGRSSGTSETRQRPGRSGAAGSSAEPCGR